MHRMAALAHIAAVYAYEQLPGPSHRPFIPACVQVTSHGLRRLLVLPALVELTVQTFCDDLDDDEDWLLDERSAELKAALASVRAAFNANGRRLTTELGRI